MPLRLVFMGTPDFAVPALLEIVGQHDIVAVYTRAPRPAGRGMGPQQSPIAREAARLGVPIFTPKTLKDATAAPAVGELNADAAVVVAYGLILPKAILDLFPRGCFNLHASLLPRWRGAAPIQRAIMTGDNDTGVMVMKMEESLDTGPIAMADRVPIGPDMTAGELHDELAQRGARLTTVALAALERGSLQLTPQSNEGVTYADKIEKLDILGVFSTPATAASRVYEIEVDKRRQDVAVFSEPCPELARLIETLGKQLKGDVRLSYERGGFVYALNVPLASLASPASE